MLGGWLAAQKHGLFREAFFIDRRLDASGAHQGEKCRLISIPTALLLLVGIEDFLRGGEKWLVLVGNTAYFEEEVGQISLLGESGELRGVIQPHIGQALNVIDLQCAEELAGIFWVKPML